LGKPSPTTISLKNYQKFLSLWEDVDPGLPEVDDDKKRLAGLKRIEPNVLILIISPYSIISIESAEISNLVSMFYSSFFRKQPTFSLPEKSFIKRNNMRAL
jgi:hypothetical protein